IGSGISTQVVLFQRARIAADRQDHGANDSKRAGDRPGHVR
ncbi:MAG: hypothetical protein QOI66_3758, partial [Myxococcales bacterium]|nr:hypothetical protein [Myxococcales bacterium]